MERFGDVSLQIGPDHVALVEIHRPPHNFFSLDMLDDLASAAERADDDGDARCIVLCSEGRNFSAGASFGGSEPELTAADPAEGAERSRRPTLYDQAVRLFTVGTPMVAAVQGAAIGGGLGLACVADFRVGGPAGRLAANFARLGFHHGFGLTVTLPAIVGQQRALELLYTGRRIDGATGADIGLLDRLVDDDRIREVAVELAAEIAASAPLAVRSIRQTMRGDLPAAIRAATDRERAEQDRLATTTDWKEGVRAMSERRTPRFTGH